MFSVPLLLLLLLSAGGACAATPWRILMLGNSYTDAGAYDYNVWQQLQNFLDADPDCAATVTRRAVGAWRLYQHATNTISTNLLVSQGPWDYVILQDQSYTPSHGWLYGGTNWAAFTNGIYPLTRMAKTQGAKVIYYQTWARGAGETGVLATNYNGSPEFMQDNITAAYGYAATYHGVKVAPVGEAWEKSLALNPELTLHAADLSHMNPRGAYLAGATLYRTITGKDPALIGYTSTLPVAEANTLRANLAALPPQANVAIDPVIPDGQVFGLSACAAPGTALGTVQAIACQPPPASNVEDPNSPQSIMAPTATCNCCSWLVPGRLMGWKPPPTSCIGRRLESQWTTATARSSSRIPTPQSSPIVLPDRTTVGVVCTPASNKHVLLE